MSTPGGTFIAHTAGEEARRLLQLAVPVAGTQLSMMLLGFVDTVMLGWYDAQAMAAAVSANVWTFATMFFASGILLGLDPVIAQAHGAGEGRKAALAFQRGSVLSLILALPVALAWMWTGSFLSLAGQDSTLVPLAQSYANSLIPGLPAFLVYSCLRGYLQGREIVRPALVIVLIANVVNAAANYALIFGNFGFPELGIVGAGVASSVTRIISLALLVAWVWGFGLQRGAWLPWSRAAFSFGGMRAILAVGLPVAIQTSTEMFAFSVSTLFAGTLGATAVVAHAISMNLASISFMLPLGVSAAVATRVGNLIGAGVPHAAQRSAWIAMGMGASVMSISAVSFVLFREWLPRMYTPDAEAVALAATILPIAGAFQLFDGTQVVGCGVLRGMGRTRPAAVFNVVGYWIFGLPLGWWFGVRVGWLGGLWWSLVLGLAIVALLIVLWIRVRGPDTLEPGARIGE
jgi:MATE family multidrug resistance protein